MSRTTEQSLSSRVILVCVILSGIFLGGQVIGWATTVCQQPNPSTEYCIDMPDGGVGDCNEIVADPTACQEADLYDRKQFPTGVVSSEEGATEEERHDCWAQGECTWNAGMLKCEQFGQFVSYHKEDKIVVNQEVQCPVPCEN